MPSMVTTRLPSIAATGVMHARVAWPSTWTVHAPQSAMPQPNLVPVRWSWSRNAQRSGVSGAARKSTGSPLTKNLAMAVGCGTGEPPLCLWYDSLALEPSCRMPRTRSRLFPTPDDAETAFYEAFERADLAAMMAVWAESDEIVCIHPQGPRLSGFEAVRESWAQNFAGGSQLRVR